MSTKSIIGFLISFLLIVALIFSVEWAKVWGILLQMQFLPLIPALILFVIQYIFRAWRWRFLLNPEFRFSIKELFDAIMVGNLANFVLPMRAGEFIRPYLLTRYREVSFASSFVSVVVERFFDLSIVLGLFATVTIINPNLPPEVNIGAYALATLAAALLLLMITGSFMEPTVLKFLTFLTSPLPKKISDLILHFTAEFLEGAALVLKTPLRGLIVVGLSLVVWLLIVLLTMVFFWPFGIYPSFEIAMATTVITALLVAAPSAPGFIGVFQWACLAAFALYSLPQEKAVAYSIITHIFNYLAFFILGGWVLWRDGLKMLDLFKKASNRSSDT